jgi:hypothetical protein
MLLSEVQRMANDKGLVIQQHLKEAYLYFYPEEADYFIPDVVDFFSVLRAYEDVARGLPGGFKQPTLLADLKFAIARLLCDRLREVVIPAAGWAKLDEIMAPGNVIITSNWDVFVEWYASQRDIRLRLGGEPHPNVLTLIKLHGSIDWTLPENRKSKDGDADYAVLRELQNGRPQHLIAINPSDVLRIRAVEHMNRSWQFIKARTAEPLMITMAQGKTTDMAPIKSMWDDAYRALGMTRTLKITGYSLPQDDVEIRTLLRAGVARRANRRATVIVVNPEPSVHVRVRTFVLREAESDYQPFTLA